LRHRLLIERICFVLRVGSIARQPVQWIGIFGQTVQGLSLPGDISTVPSEFR
jgi:hypothetical protein